MKTLVIGALICIVSFTNTQAQTSSLLPQFQGMVDVSPTTPLMANAIAGADSYVFELVTAYGYFEEEVTSTDHEITMAESSLSPGILRDITVRVKTISSGVVSDYGPPVTFTTSGAPIIPCTDILALEELVNPGIDLDFFRQWRIQKAQLKRAEVEGYRGGGCQTSYRIPVVFHVVYDQAVAGSNVSDALILDQLQILNDEFNALNPGPMGGNACIEFCLAQNTPTNEPWNVFGSTTPGITRWNDAVAAHHGEGLMAQQQLVDVVMFPREQYLNVWICSDVLDGPNNVVGYATLPPALGAIDGVVMEFPFVAD